MTAGWGKITAGEILAPVRGKLVQGVPETVFTGLSTDSREIIEGCLFWALRGERYDGHDFAAQAAERGAAGLVVEEGSGFEIPSSGTPAVIRVSDTLAALGDLASWWRYQHGVRVAAITGSVGKTTTKEMAAGILELGAPTLKNKGNFNNLVGLPLTLFSLSEVHGRAVLEMGMNRPGEIGRLTKIADPDVGLITNVARAHLEGLGNLQGVARAKVELLREMSAEGQALVNGDDELLLKEACSVRKEVLTFGMGPENEIRALGVKPLGVEGVSFEIRARDRVIPVRLRVPGRQNVYNALAACSIALCMGEPAEHIARGLETFKGIKGRFMVSSIAGGVTLVDDTYNSNPSSLKAAVEAVGDLAAGRGRVIVGLGDMLELGAEAGPAHREAGELVAKIGTHCFLAMGEHARDMIEGAVRHGIPAERARVVEDHEEMVRRIREVMQEGDLILLKGSRRMGLEKVVAGLEGAVSQEVEHGHTQENPGRG